MALQKNEHPENDMSVSVCPSGEVFALPNEKEYPAEYEKLKELVADQRQLGREIVVVMGVGFVGAVMAGVVADSTREGTDEPLYFVIGMQRPSTRSYWKIPYLNRGVAPVEAEDPEVAPLIERCVKQRKNLMATYTYDALLLADVVVVDVQCDYQKETLADVDAVVLAVRHQHYLKLTPEKVLAMTKGPVAVIDCFGILDDAAIQRYIELDCEVKGLGRGHIKRIKEMVRTSK